MLDKAALRISEAVEASIEGTKAAVKLLGFRFTFHGELFREALVEELEAQIGELTTMAHDFEAGDGAGPGSKIRPGFEARAFFPENDIGLL